MTERDKRLMALAPSVYTGQAQEANMISPDIVWLRQNPVSGDYCGREYFKWMPLRTAPLSRWEFAVERELVNGDNVVTQVQLADERKGKTIDTHGESILCFDANDQIGEGWSFADPQDAPDEFFAA